MPDLHRLPAGKGGGAASIELHTADMTALPFPDASFDVVTSALAIHTIPTRHGRDRAVTEAVRTLRPGGRLLIADFRHRRLPAPARPARQFMPVRAGLLVRRPLGRHEHGHSHKDLTQTDHARPGPCAM